MTTTTGPRRAQLDPPPWLRLLSETAAGGWRSLSDVVAGRDTTNASDEIFPTGGDPAVLDILPTADGYRAGICLVVPDAGDAS